MNKWKVKEEIFTLTERQKKNLVKKFITLRTEIATGYKNKTLKYPANTKLIQSMGVLLNKMEPHAFAEFIEKYK